VHQELGQPDQVLAALAQAVAKEPDNLEARLALSQAYVAIADYAAALEQAQQAAAGHPQSGAAFVALGDAYAGSGDIQAAKQAYEQAAVAEPGYGAGQAALGRLYSGVIGDEEATITAYEAALAEDPEQPAVYDALVALYREHDRVAASLPRLEATALTQPEQVWPKVALALLYEQTGRRADAIAQLQQALTIRPDFADIYRRLGRLEQADWDFAAAREAYLHFLELEPDSPVSAEVQGYLGEMAGQESSVRIGSPAEGEVLRGEVAILGTASIATFGFYKLEYRPADTQEEWHVFALVETPVVEGELAKWNTSGLPAGEYLLRLTVVDSGGNFPPYDELRVSIAQGMQ
jgi:tetratricopeptide (TPR) repeat protein